jgi:hypothetical protein
MQCSPGALVGVLGVCFSFGLSLPPPSRSGSGTLSGQLRTIFSLSRRASGENVEVQLIRMEDPKESFVAMGAGRLDGIVSTIDTMIPHLKTGKEFQYVLALDDSAGGDGIVSRKEIKSIRDVRGRKVAVAGRSL